MKVARTPRTGLVSALALVAALPLLGGCISAPNVVLVDHKTALEQQAAGEFRALEGELEQAGTLARPEDIPGSKLQGDSGEAGDGRFGEVARLYSAERDDAQRIDALLKSHCVGEALDGTLRQTAERCRADVDATEVTRLVERANLHRRQLWTLLKSLTPTATDEKVRDAWRARHLQRVICDGLVQMDQDNWEGKKC